MLHRRKKLETSLSPADIAAEQRLLRLVGVADIFDGYRLARAWDEMFAAPGKPRPAYDALFAVRQPMDPGELRYRADQLARVFTDRGVTYDYAGEERAFPTDLIPRVVEAREWELVSRGVKQRVKVLEAFLADVYGDGRAFDAGVVPWRLVYTSDKFCREVAGFTPPNGVRVHIAGIDLIRDEQGKFRVLEDNVRVPSGVSYVLENRLAMTRIFPALFAEQRIHQVDEYPSRLLGALRAAAPHGVVDRVTYMPGATGVRTNAQEAWDEGKGVCQDMAQLAVALMRAAGLPSRYVSGYLHPKATAEPGTTAVGQSHAWAEYWAGSWIPLDPTSGANVAERHVVVARGRDYTDVPPLKGIYHGPAHGDMTVTVEVTRQA
jgi:hypothetical protein